MVFHYMLIISKYTIIYTNKFNQYRLSLVGPTKVMANKSFLFTKGFPKVENKEYLFDFVVTLYSLITLLESSWLQQSVTINLKKFTANNFFTRPR